MAKYNPGRTGKATRPIIREVESDDINAAFGMAVHESVGIRAVPNASPGLLVTNPAIAGVVVKRSAGGGYFNPPDKTSKFV